MLTTDAASFYGTPTLILEASDAHQVRKVCAEIVRKVKPKDGERVSLVVYKRTEETHGE